MNETDPAFAKANTKPEKTCVAFYNIENLFDTEDDPHTLDDDFTPKGFKNWHPKRYEKKLRKISAVIANIGKEETNVAPSLIGLAEVENEMVVQALADTKALRDNDYGVAHFDSPDERGIDVALLYRKSDFDLIESRPINVFLETSPGVQDYTRDVLYVHGRLHGNEIHILINHWPSRRQGVEETEHKRIAVAERNREIIASITAIDPEARIIVMGDFNDGPRSTSVQQHLVQQDFYNPMIFLGTRYEGSLNHNFEWYLFDQIILSNNFMQLHRNPLRYDESKIYNDIGLTEFKGRFKGNPFRTYAGKRYLGGYSDHFPVYTIFDLNPS